MKLKMKVTIAKTYSLTGMSVVERDVLQVLIEEASPGLISDVLNVSQSKAEEVLCNLFKACNSD